MMVTYVRDKCMFHAESVNIQYRLVKGQQRAESVHLFLNGTNDFLFSGENVLIYIFWLSLCARTHS